MKEFLYYLLLVIVLHFTFKFIAPPATLQPLKFLSTYQNLILLNGDLPSDHPTLPLYQRVYLLSDQATSTSPLTTPVRLFQKQQQMTGIIYTYDSIQLSPAAMSAGFLEVSNMNSFKSKSLVLPLRGDQCWGRRELRMDGRNVCEMNVTVELLIGIAKKQSEFMNPSEQKEEIKQNQSVSKREEQIREDVKANELIENDTEANSQLKPVIEGLFKLTNTMTGKAQERVNNAQVLPEVNQQKEDDPKIIDNKQVLNETSLPVNQTIDRNDSDHSVKIDQKQTEKVIQNIQSGEAVPQLQPQLIQVQKVDQHQLVVTNQTQTYEEVQVQSIVVPLQPRVDNIHLAEIQKQPLQPQIQANNQTSSQPLIEEIKRVQIQQFPQLPQQKQVISEQQKGHQKEVAENVTVTSDLQNQLGSPSVPKIQVSSQQQVLSSNNHQVQQHKEVNSSEDNNQLTSTEEHSILKNSFELKMMDFYTTPILIKPDAVFKPLTPLDQNINDASPQRVITHEVFQNGQFQNFQHSEEGQLINPTIPTPESQIPPQTIKPSEIQIETSQTPQIQFSSQYLPPQSQLLSEQLQRINSQVRIDN